MSNRRRSFLGLGTRGLIRVDLYMLTILLASSLLFQMSLHHVLTEAENKQYISEEESNQYIRRVEPTAVRSTRSTTRFDTAILPFDPHIDSKTRSSLDVRLFFRGEAVFLDTDAGGSVEHDAITAVTQLSASPTKLQRLVDLASRWDGYISVALYVRDEGWTSTLVGLRSFFKEHSSLFKRTIVYLVSDQRAKDDITYPINVLRNMAIEYAPTDQILMLDVDFIPSVNAHSRLVKHFDSVSATGELSVLIIPAFERILLDGEDESSTLDTFDLPPRKSDLLRLVEADDNTLTPFHTSVASKFHGPTDFNRWYEATEPYQVEYSDQFEPYFVIKKDSRLPLLWEYFHNFGFNKWTWVGELALAGYTFNVDPDCFIVHINHDYTTNEFSLHFSETHHRKLPTDMVEEYAMRFNEAYLWNTYGRNLSWEVSFYWPQLPEPMKAAAGILGYDREKWDRDEDIPAYHRMLTPAEVQAVRILGLRRHFRWALQETGHVA